MKGRIVRWAVLLVALAERALVPFTNGPRALIWSSRGAGPLLNYVLGRQVPLEIETGLLLLIRYRNQTTRHNVCLLVFILIVHVDTINHCVSTRVLLQRNHVIVSHPISHIARRRILKPLLYHWTFTLPTPPSRLSHKALSMSVAIQE